MHQPRLVTMVFLLAAAALSIYCLAGEAQAVPSFARQTGASGKDCHTVYPELTPFGRAFKLGGYVMSQSDKRYEYPPPISAGGQVSYTEGKGLSNRIDPFDDSPNAKFNVPQTFSSCGLSFEPSPGSSGPFSLGRTDGEYPFGKTGTWPVRSYPERR